ncbi:MAG: type I-C CRISPR-associated protein Cas8c/Csd1 [Pseudomonadota bacterium]
MTWMAKLYDTYDHINDFCERNGSNPPWPISHFVKNAHIEVVISLSGQYIKSRSKILDGTNSATLIPASESSAGRSGSKNAPHPLCEELSYCASDYPNIKAAKLNAYMEQLKSWVEFDASHTKLSAIYNYLLNGSLWSDLSNEFEFPLKIKKFNGTSQKITVDKTFIRWKVEEHGNPISGTWEDEELIQSWIDYDKNYNSKDGFCYITGKESRVAANHPRFLRWAGDGAKIISSNDSSGFTFRGRFTDSNKTIQQNGTQSVGIGFDVTQKAHNALRWLILQPNCFRNDTQFIISWAVSTTEIPELMKDSYSLLALANMPLEEIQTTNEQQIDHTIDLGQSFARNLNKYLSGYQANFSQTDNIVIMGLDSATPGRMAITYYQEFFPDDYIEKISQWHNDFAWFQRHYIEEDIGQKKPKVKTIWPISSPSPHTIWEAVYGSHITDSLKKNTVDRILACITESQNFPLDLVLKSVHRASNRNIKRLSDQYSSIQSEKLAWEKDLCVACALFKGYSKRNNQQKEYKMALEINNDSRDYLYGRLLAIAEQLEDMALYVAGENRPTTAARLMQRFAERPASTWRNIELALQPYIQRLKNNRAGYLHNIQLLMDDVMDLFQAEDFISDKSLSGEFLLAYHTQRLALRHKNKKTDNDETEY